MKAAAVVSCLASLANAAVVSFDKRATSSSASPLDVKIEHVGNSEVKATITNTGSSSLRVLKAGSLFDESPVEKTKVSQGGTCFLHSASKAARIELLNGSEIWDDNMICNCVVLFLFHLVLLFFIQK